MALQRLIRGRFAPYLEDELCRSVRESRARDPLRPLLVIVPSHALRVGLRRRLVQECGEWLGVTVLLYEQWVREHLLWARLAEHGWRGWPGGVRELLLDRWLDSAQAEPGPYRGIADLAGFRSALLGVLADLMHSRLRAAELERAAEGATRPLSDKLRCFAAAMQHLGSFDPTRRTLAELEESALAAVPAYLERCGRPGVLLYGFYDFNAGQAALFETLLRTADSEVYFPCTHSVRADEYSEPGWCFFQGLGPGFVTSEVLEGDALRFAGRLFADGLSGEASTASTPVSPPVPITISTAPFQEHEVREMARRMLELAEHTPFREMAVILRYPDAYRRPLRDTLHSLGIPVHFHDGWTLDSSPRGRALLAALSLPERAYERNAVFEVLRGMEPASPVLRAVGLQPGISAEMQQQEGSAATPPLSWERRVIRWERLAREIGLVEGREQWLSRASSAHRRWAAQLADLSLNPYHQELFVEIEPFVAFFQEFMPLFEVLECTGPLEERLAAFRRLVLDYFVPQPGVPGEPDPEALGPEKAEKLLAGLEEVAVLGGEVTAESFRFLAKRHIEGLPMGTGAALDAGVFISGIESARGRHFAQVFLLGLTEHSFPRQVRQDPLLTDQDRRNLGQLSGKEPPLKLRGHIEEKLLFALCLGMARQGLHLSYPRRNSRTGAEIQHSHFLAELAEACLGRPFDYARRGELAAEVPGLEWRDVAATASGRLPLDSREVQLAVAAAWTLPEEFPAALLPPAEQPPFGRVQEFLTARQGRERRRLTSYEGLIRREALLTLLRESHAITLPERGTSTSRLADFAECPLRYFYKYVLHIHEFEQPQRTLTLESNDRGTWLHSIFHRFLKQCEREGLLPLREERRRRCMELLEHELDGVMEHQARFTFAVSRTLARQQLWEDLQHFLEHEFHRQAEGLLPRYFEVPFGPQGRASQEPDPEEAPTLTLPRAVEMEVEELGTVRLSGRIDRIDRVEPEVGPPELRLVDYKTGKREHFSNLTKGKTAKAGKEGKFLQLYVYQLAIEQNREMLPGEVAGSRIRAAEFYFPTQDGGDPLVVLEGDPHERVPLILGVIGRSIVGGLFPPNQKSCGFCPYTAICGKGQVQRYGEDKAEDERAEDYWRLYEGKFTDDEEGDA